MNNINTRQLNTFAFVVGMKKFRSSLSDQYLADKELKVLGCYDDDGNPLGFALYHFYEEGCAVYHIEVGEDDKDCVSALLKEIIQQCDTEGIEKIFWDTTFPIPPDGFTTTRIDTVYRLERKNIPGWEGFKDRVRPLVNRVKQKGFKTIPLKECTEQQIEEIKTEYKNYGDNGYMEGIFEGYFGEVLTDISMVTLQDDHVSAFTIVTGVNAKNCTLRYFCSTEKYHNTGVMTLPLIESVDAMFSQGYDCMRWTIKEGNPDSMNFVIRYFPELEPKTKLYSYEYRM